jgi:hypothetical protein
MKYTLLEMTQNILASMDGDEVDSINDTAESRQVSQLIRTAYFNIVSRANLPEHKTLFQLTSSGNTSYPVKMTAPSNVTRIDWIKYNTSTDSVDDFNYVTILPIQQFVDMMDSLNESETNVDTMTINNNVYYFRNDKKPEFCMVLDDNIIIFDSYDSSVETTLQTSKTMCYGQTMPTFSLTDNAIPNLDDAQFALLLNEAKALCFVELKQTPNQKAEQEARRQWRTVQRTKTLEKTKPFDEFAYYGRK